MYGLRVESAGNTNADHTSLLQPNTILWDQNRWAAAMLQQYKCHLLIVQQPPFGSLPGKLPLMFLDGVALSTASVETLLEKAQSDGACQAADLPSCVSHYSCNIT